MSPGAKTEGKLSVVDLRDEPDYLDLLGSPDIEDIEEPEEQVCLKLQKMSSKSLNEEKEINFLNEDELIDDGYFENLMRGQNPESVQLRDIPDDYCIESFHENLGSPVSQDYPKVDLNALITKNVKETYFPKNSFMYNTFQGMLRKEQQLHDKRLAMKLTLHEKQPSMTPEMRLILLDWLCEVCSDYSLKRQTFHRSVCMVDSFLENCPEILEVSEFQTIGATCLQMAAKIEEIYPPHINCFSQATDNSVTTEEINKMEYRVCDVLNWNLEDFQTFFSWTTWFMQRWDDYVDDSLSYLKQQFHLKFFERGSIESSTKFFTLMNYIDIVSMSVEAKQFSPRILIACVMYLIIGGKDIMHAFQMDYSEMCFEFKDHLPIIEHGDTTAQRQPEGILFYNQIIQPFFSNEFGFYLSDLIAPLRFVLQFFVLPADKQQPSECLVA